MNAKAETAKKIRNNRKYKQIPNRFITQTVGDLLFKTIFRQSPYAHYSGKTTSFTITVNNPPAVVSSIAIQSKPTKTVYTVGEKFDASGLSVKVTMSDGTTKTITSGFTLSNPDMTVTGTKTVTVTYSGKTASFTITVKAAEPSVNAGALRLITPASARIG